MSEPALKSKVKHARGEDDSVQLPGVYGGSDEIDLSKVFLP